MRRFGHTMLLLAALTALSGQAARATESDSARLIERVEVVAVKLGNDIRRLPAAATLLGRQELERRRIHSLQEAAATIPNLHMPEYGSRMTSSVYVRGLGARIDQPVLGLNIDNVPILNKDAYDTELTDIARIELLRGPQGTLYGRNTMGGVMNIHTLSPLHFQGGLAGIEYAGGRSFKARASGYFRPAPQWGLSAAAYYTSTRGLYRNAWDGSFCDGGQSAGGRIRAEWQGSRGWQVGNALSLTWVDQGGYPYAAVSDGEIAYNDPCGYRRTALVDGLTVRYTGESIAVEGITSYQLLDDDMVMDQDFRPASLFTLRQQRREHALTEEWVVRSKGGRRYEWLAGLFGFWRTSEMKAPVTFKEQGLRELIIDNVREHAGYAPEFFSPEFPFVSDFRTPGWGIALYHESTLRLGRWSLTAGIRIEHEQSRMDYRSATLLPCRIAANEIAPFALTGRLGKHFTEWLPKFSVLRRLGRNDGSTLYLSAAKGYKAGGFNTQMFSDVLQQALMERMGVTQAHRYDTDQIVAYDPEESWNFEAGGHTVIARGDLTVDWALFWIACRNQQLTVFPEGQVTGRLMTNAGRSRSLGAECSVTARPWSRLTLNASYGFTDARFTRYRSGGHDYAGRRIPYVPAHTLSLRAAYVFETGLSWAERLVPSAGWQAAGAIAWNEENTLQQPFYGTGELSVRIEARRWTVDLWCRNVTGTRYDLFYFESVGRGFVQRGRPRQFGITLQISL